MLRSSRQRAPRARRFAVVLIGCVALGAAHGPALAAPPGGVVDLEEALPDDAAPTERSAHADELFRRARWDEAAPVLLEVASGATGDAGETRRIAGYELGVALYQLGFLQAAYARFASIAADPHHPRFAEALPWLALLAEKLPEPANVIERIGHYDERMIEALAGEPHRPIYDQLEYLLGRYEYGAHSFDAAIRLFDRVGDESDWYVPAKLFTGISHVQKREEAPAAAAFEAALAALAKGAGGDDRGRLTNLAYLSLARTYYSSSVRLDDDGVPRIDATKLDAAIGYWDRVDDKSEYWPDAVVEESWAYFMKGDHARALGNVFTVESPFFSHSLFPEADVVAGVSYLANCRYEDAAAVASRLERRYGPMARALRAELARYDGDDADDRLFDLVRDLGERRADVPPALAPLLARVLGDRKLRRIVDWVAMLDAERERLRRRGARFGASPLGLEIGDALDLARAVAVAKAASAARASIEGILGELDDHLANARKILADVTVAKRHEEGEFMQTRTKYAIMPAPAIEIDADDEHEVWPFDGEFWRDEVGAYREVIVSECAR